LGILSYGITKKNKIHKVNFWNSMYSYYIGSSVPEKISHPEIQNEIRRLENTLTDVLLRITDTDSALSSGNGVYKIIINNHFYSFYMSSEMPKFFRTQDLNGIELALREIMDLIHRNKVLNIVPFPENFMDLRKKAESESEHLKRNSEELPSKQGSYFLNDVSDEIGLNFSERKPEDKNNDLLSEINYNLGQAFQSLNAGSEKIQVLYIEDFHEICTLHQRFLSSLPEKPEIKWERTGISSESEVQYLSKKYPNYIYLGKFTHCILEDFSIQKLNLMISNFSQSEIHQCRIKEVNLSRSIAVMSFWYKTDFESVNFERTDFSESKFIQCRFVNCSFLLSDLEETFFSSCDFQSCSFVQTKLKSSEMEKSKFSECSFSRSRLIRTSFKDCIFENSSLKDSVQKESSFSFCSFS
ncbi:MAG TPA: pentapeptide repeat-containing protein, partial [Leptospiraceae bacterium]|nr:pentapeptide repeat-containing protein [Leptospiraceae bacterium]